MLATKPSMLFLLLLVILPVMMMIGELMVIVADIPVHCVHHNIGNSEWKLYLSPMIYSVKQDEKAHSIQRKQHIPLNCTRMEREDVNVARIVNVYLQLPNIVRSENKNGNVIGTWTMVYDQGFEITLSQYNHNYEMSMFAFSMFEKVNSTSELIRSKCHQTFVGNYRKTSYGKQSVTSFGCYYAEKVYPQPTDVKVSLPINTLLYKFYDPKNQGKGLNVNNDQSEFDSLADELGLDLRLMRTNDPKEKFKTDRTLIDWINTQSDDLGWSARSYSQFEQFTNEEMERMNGARSILVDKSDLKKPQNLDQEEENFALAFDEIDFKSPLPENFDWRNVSAVTAIESRIRIQTKNKLKPLLAVQDIVSCSPYAQKCHGGIPYSIGRHLRDFTLVPESCFPYTGSEHIPCDSKCNNPPYIVKMKDYKYVGDFYGAGNEENMKREIFRHGPVSVVITGWGVDPVTGQKYWNVMNSWGERWGDSGFFRIARGNDECAIEAEPVAFYPEVVYTA
ncbi:hypothetical protein C9374_001345 [Naegleria lovaniensis]|uniref:Peptidase C1A papain C-terminal domain-containing protein n=1 Tax=Naegleria lovaniensis TaxID=51637 RepID=A0AA88GSV3_NAELO|nr:uncharacterized protein C9374_001345 [Naegleria lovaniensis]KAG2387751.1 hypothetical protein C9374_001345 [Naegleria lovaniensis]